MSAPTSRHIYIYSPSSAVHDRPAFRRGVARLKALGYSVEVDADALSRHMRFAGDDETRLAAIHRAAASGADVALISRGGYGLTRILPGLDTRAIAKAVERGTQFVGLSDFTALQCAVLAKTGAITWAGPALGEDFGVDGTPDDIMEACFDDLLLGQGEGAGWRLPADSRGLKSATSIANKQGLTGDEGQIHIKKATLWGGNLAILAALVGTPWLPQVRGGVLFIEDVHEHPFRVERMLTQLLYAGVLARQKAIVFGQFTQYRLAPHDKGFKLATVVQWLRARLRIPVLTGLPFGHVPTKVLLPVGATVSLNTDGTDALMFWGS